MLRFIPNILTIGRIVLTVIFLTMLLYYPDAENKTAFMDTAFLLFVVTCITDLIDGPIARALNVTSKFGRMLVNKLPGPMTINSEANMAWITWG